MDTKSKERKSDRILVLKAREGAKSSTGLIDPRLFSGENKLHVKMDPERSIWSFQYEHGGLPQPLKQSFTSFGLAYQHAERYLNSRGIDIVEVLD